MVASWYSLVIGILICIEGIILLIFDVDGFQAPNWYLGMVILAGVVGILIGLISIMKKKPAVEQKDPEKDPDIHQDSGSGEEKIEPPTVE